MEWDYHLMYHDAILDVRLLTIQGIALGMALISYVS